MAHATLTCPVSLRSTWSTKLPWAKRVPWPESKTHTPKDSYILSPLPLLIQIQTLSVFVGFFHFCLFFIVSHIMNAKCLIFFVSHYLRKLWEQQPKKWTFSSLSSWKRCPHNTSSVCNQHSDQISMLKNVYAILSICRPAQSFALKRITKQLYEYLALGAATCRSLT